MSSVYVGKDGNLKGCLMCLINIVALVKDMP